MKKLLITRSILVTLFLVVMAIVAIGAGSPRTVTLGWDYSDTPASELLGYTVYAGPTVVAVLGITNTVTFGGLANGTYLYSVTCRSTNNIESDPSNVVRVTVPHPPKNLK